MTDVAVKITGENTSQPEFQALEKSVDSVAGAIKELTQVSKESAKQISDSLTQTQQKEEEVAKKTEETTKKFSFSWQNAALALAGAGAALEVMGRRAAVNNEMLDKMEVVTGIASKRLRQFSLDITTSTDGIAEMTQLMDLAAKAGARTENQLKSFAQFWDLVGDATGASAVALANYEPTLRAFGIGLGQETKALSAFGYIQTQTSIGVESFMSIMQRCARQVSAMGVSLDDTAAIFGFLESKGIKGRAAMQTFNSAVNDSKGNQAEFFKALGMTSSTLDEYRTKIENCSTVIDDLAAVEANHHTLLDQIQNILAKVEVQYGTLIERLSQAAPILIGLGMVIGGVASAWPALAGAAGAAASAVGIAVGPLLLIIAGIAAAVALLVVAWTKNWGDIQGKTKAIWDFISGDLTSTISQIVTDMTAAGAAIWTAIEPTFRQIQELFTVALPIILPIAAAVFQGIYELTTVAMGLWYNSVKEKVQLIWEVLQWFGQYAGPFIQTVVGGWILIFQNLPNMGELIRDAFDGLIITLKEYADKCLESGKGLIQAFTNGILSLAMAPVNAIRSILERVRAYLPGSDAETGPLSDLTASGTGMMQALASGIEKGSPLVEGAVERAMVRAKGKIVKFTPEYGKDTETTGASAAVFHSDQSSQEQAAAIAKQRAFESQTKIEQLQQQYDAERTMLEEHGQSTVATDQYYQGLMYAERQRLRDIDTAAQQAAMQNQATVAAGFSSLMSALYEQGGKQSMALFALMKAGAIAEAIINANLAFTKALTMGPIIGPVMAGIVFASAMVHVAQIASQEVAMAKGGIVTSPTHALIGEAGPEAVIPLDRFTQPNMDRVIVQVFIQDGIWTTSPQSAQDLARLLEPYLTREAAR